MKRFWAVLLSVLLLTAAGCTGEVIRPDSSTQQTTDPSGQESSGQESSREEESQPQEASSKEEESSKEADSSAAQESSKEDSSASESSIQEESSADEPVDEEAAMREAYRQVIEGLTQQYGEGSISESPIDGQSVMKGLAVVRLLDFDADGIQELYCAYAKEGSPYANRQEIYQYRDNEAVLIYESSISNEGTDVSPMTRLVYKDGLIYLAEGIPFSLKGSYLKLTDGQMQPEFHFESGYMSDSGKYYINGTEVTEDEYRQQTEAFLENTVTADIWYYGKLNESTGFGVDPENLSRTQDVIAELA